MQYPNFFNSPINNNGMQQFQMPNNQYLPRTEVIKVNGQAGANNLHMAPNSSMLVLDETAPIVWYAQTDGTGYLTVTPFDISPHQSQQQININVLAERISKLEEEMASVQQSNTIVAKQSKKQRQQPATTATNDSTV